MASAIEIALEQTRAAGGMRVHVLRLRVGTLSGIVPEALQFAFEALSAGTIAEKARLEMETVPARFWCAQCGQEFESESLLAECSRCGELSHELRSGRELEIASLEID